MDQQAVEFLQLLTSFLLNPAREDTMWVDGDLLEVLGLDSLECHGDPLDPRTPASERQTFESCGRGEVERRLYGPAYVHE